MPQLFEPLETYYRLLARWNEKINLTALPLRTPTDATFDRLLIEPIAAARYVPASGVVWFDLGSGGGSPAIPLKLVRPGARLTMVEARARKAAFLREAARLLSLRETVVENVRFEALGTGNDRQATESADLVTVRAVKVDGILIEAAAKLLAPGGRLLLFARQPGDISALRAFSCEQTAKLTPAESSDLTVFIRQLR